jgi:mannitol-1-phosphate 5-dehydrogenase
LKELLATSTADEATSRLTGLDASHPLYDHVVRVVERVQKS